MTLPKVVDQGARLALTTAEVNILTALANSGDRAGFYLAYYAMTGNKDALLESKISTFSAATGGIAFAANWLLQDQFRTTAPTNGTLPNEYPSPYQGIYWLSQGIAQRTLITRDSHH